MGQAGQARNETLANPFSRAVWRDYLKGYPRLSQTLAAGEVDAGGDGEVKNYCKCDKPCGAVKCAPGMWYEWPRVFPKLPE